eukprot:s1266_g14.t1
MTVPCLGNLPEPVLELLMMCLVDASYDCEYAAKSFRAHFDGHAAAEEFTADAVRSIMRELVYPPSHMKWLGGDQDREAWYGFKFRPDQVLECSVRDDAGHTQGTIAVKVLEKKATGPVGHFVVCKYLSASDPHYRWWATDGPGRGLSKSAVYHFCDGNSHECREKYGRQMVIHVESFRLITDEVNKNKSPAWMFSKPCFPEMEQHLKDLPKGRPGKQGEELPWVDQEKEDSSESSETSEDVSDDDMKMKISKLKRELAAARKEAKKGKDGKRRRTPKRGDDDKPKDKRKRREKSQSSEKRGDKKDGKKEKKKRKRSPSKKRKERPGSARDKKPRRHRSRSGERKQRRSSSSEDDGERKLFGGDGSDGDESDSPGGKKGDRGPFGGAEKEQFGDRKGDDSSEESPFREAPTQGAATSQLKLTEYAQRYPGRLAARLLLRMHRESSLASVGATLGKKRTPAAALHYLQTMMLPSLGQKVNMRTGRELRTLCTVLDMMARHKMPQAADVIAQRVKALERACQEGHWGAAQFLELIAGEQQGLLDRSEQYYLSKEYVLEQKLRGLDKNAPRLGKGDQKGVKGRGGKGDREKGGGAGKGKEKPDSGTK